MQGVWVGQRQAQHAFADTVASEVEVVGDAQVALDFHIQSLMGLAVVSPVSNSSACELQTAAGMVPCMVHDFNSSKTR